MTVFDELGRPQSCGKPGNARAPLSGIPTTFEGRTMPYDPKPMPSASSGRPRGLLDEASTVASATSIDVAASSA